MDFASSAGKDRFPVSEYRYNRLTEEEAEYFRTDPFYIVFSSSKKEALSIVAEYFNTGYKTLCRYRPPEDLDGLSSADLPAVLLFPHIDVTGNFLPVKKIAGKCREKGIITILDVTDSTRQINPYGLPADLLICDNENYCTIVFNEYFLRVNNGLPLRKRLIERYLSEK